MSLALLLLAACEPGLELLVKTTKRGERDSMHESLPVELKRNSS